MTIRDRITAFRRIPARELRPNPYNWRTHSRQQQLALEAVLAEIGYAGALLARELPDGALELIDGHLRAETTPDQLVPVLILDVNEDEAQQLLAFWDPLSALAGKDEERAQALAEQIQTTSPALQGLLDQLRGGPLAESAAPTVPVEMETSYQVVVHCGDEAQQRELFDRFTAEGLRCRVLTM
jgi:hypothetical protein